MLSSADAFLCLMAAIGLFAVASPFLIWGLSAWAESAARDRLRATGTRCLAVVKSFRRISMTQHRVVFEIRLPTGSIGREYVLSGLADDWLADALALGREVPVIAHPDAGTILLAR